MDKSTRAKKFYRSHRQTKKELIRYWKEGRLRSINADFFGDAYNTWRETRMAWGRKIKTTFRKKKYNRFASDEFMVIRNGVHLDPTRKTRVDEVSKRLKTPK